MKIDCDTCVVRGDACSDCVVSFLMIPVRSGLRSADARRVGGTGAPVEVDDAQVRAIRTLANAGLVAPLRHLA
jgi:hypothetical protein